MTLTKLRSSPIVPTNALAQAINNHVGADCPYGDFIKCYYFADAHIDNEHFVQCGVIKNKSGYSVVTFNCSLIRPNYPIDTWQIDKTYSSSTDKYYAIHHFRTLVLRILSQVMHLTTEEALNV